MQSLMAPPLYRRLLGMLYDFLIGGTMASIVAAIIIGIFFARGKGIPADTPLAYSIFALELFVGFFYFQWFILHQGQSLGMSVWKIQIGDLRGNRVSYSQIAIRYLALVILVLAGFLLGYKILSLSGTASLGIAMLFLLVDLLWSFTNPQRLALHEVISQTRLIDARL